MRARLTPWLALVATACVFDPRAIPQLSGDAGAVPIDTGVFRVDAGRPRDGSADDAAVEAVCGDGLRADEEACDDGNGDDRDGCSRDCAVEAGYTCAGQPSFCANAAPMALDDAVRTREDTPLEFEPLANDVDVAGDVLTLVDTSTPSLGRVTLRPLQRLLYTPDPDAYGLDQFRYRIRDSAGQLATATVTVTVLPVNDAPIAHGVGVRTAYQTSIDVHLDATEPDGHTVRFQVTAPAHGALGPVDQAQGRVRYTPASGYVGRDMFRYVASDASGLSSATATVSLVVLPRDWGVVDAQWRRALCVDGSTLSEDLSGFPALVRAPPGTWAGAAAQGSDLVFRDGAGERYLHEVEQWAPDGDSVVWVRVPRVRSATTTCWSAYFGRSMPGPTPDARAVWSAGFTSVVHLGRLAEDARRGEPIVITGTSTASGVVGQARAFGGGYVDLARGVLEASRGTLSAWVRVDPSIDLVDDAIIAYGTRATMGTRQGLGRDELHLSLDADERLRFFAWGSLGVTDLVASARIATGAWRHVAVTWADDAVLYVDGVERARAPHVADPFASDVLTRLGAPFDASVRGFMGSLDEVRTASVARSPSWLRAERATVVDASFVTLGPLDDGVR